MLTSDLPAFTRMMQLKFYGMASSSRIVYHVDGSAPHTFALVPHPDGGRSGIIRTKLQLQPGSGSRAVSESLLLYFRNMIHPEQKTDVLGADEDVSNITRDLHTIMSPKTIWLAPMLWNMYENFNSMMNVADELAVAGDSERAATWYHLIWSTFSPCAIFKLDPQVFQADTALSLPLALVLNQYIGSLVGYACLRIRQGQPTGQMMDDTAETMSALFQFLGATKDATVPYQKQSAPAWLGFPKTSTTFSWFVRMCRFEECRTGDNLWEAFEAAFHGHAECATDGHLEHDMKLFERLVEGKKV